MLKSYKAIFSVAVTYIGAIIGAGFASGQEILQFFTLQGGWGYLGVLICGFLFGVSGYTILVTSSRYNLKTYDQLFHKFGNKKMSNFADLIMLFFLFGSFIVMLSGSGEVFISHFKSNKNVGIFFTLIIIIWAIKFGIKGVIKLNMLLIPGLILIIIMTFIFNVDFNYIFVFQNERVGDSILSNCFLRSAIYVIYNLFLALPVLVAIPTEISREDILKKGSILAGVLLAIMAFVINTLLAQNSNLVLETQIPILKILSYKSVSIYACYSLVLWLAMITTATSSLYGLVTRMKERFFISENKILIILIFTSFLLARFRFNSLVGIVYPLLGYVGGFLLISLLLNYLKDKFII
jgi:uncharacterized membrane protein YkvI